MSENGTVRMFIPKKICVLRNENWSSMLFLLASCASVVGSDLSGIT